MKRVTIKDIARLLGIAPSTVSRSLADHPDISSRTKEKVKKLAEELGYRPNHIAVNFRKQNSGLIALILPEISMFFFPQVIKAAEATIKSQGFSLIVLHSQNSLALEKENLELCTRFSVDGLLLSLSKETTDLAHVNALTDLNLPIVLFDRILPSETFSTLTIDDRKVAQQAVELLIHKGHRKICGMFGFENLHISKERHRGFVHAMEKHDLKVNTDWVLHYQNTAGIINELTLIMAAPDRPTAVFAMSDELLAGIYHAMAQLGLKIPNDVAVICISEGYIPDFFFPKVTYVRHSGYEVGAKSSEVLLRIMQASGESSPIHEQITPQLVIQGSV
ncbi:MAG: LacI family DNA-binding transcriptional regulator [Bacteroidota bacterium]